MRRVQEGFVAYLTAGLIPMLVSMASAVVGIVVIYGLVFLAMLPGLQSSDEGLAAMGAVGGSVGGVFVMVLGLTVAVAPMQASLHPPPEHRRRHPPVGGPRHRALQLACGLLGTAVRDADGAAVHPFIGMALLVTVLPLDVLLAYRQVFGDGDQPRGFEV